MYPDIMKGGPMKFNRPPGSFPHFPGDIHGNDFTIIADFSILIVYLL